MVKKAPNIFLHDKKSVFMSNLPLDPDLIDFHKQIIFIDDFIHFFSFNDFCGHQYAGVDGAQE